MYREHLATFCRRLGKPLLHWLTQGFDLQITKQNQAGTEIWKVYDPITNETLQFDHEEALRSWIDQRYNR